jgi:hypothetical protein
MPVEYETSRAGEAFARASKLSKIFASAGVVAAAVCVAGGCGGDAKDGNAVFSAQGTSGNTGLGGSSGAAASSNAGASASSGATNGGAGTAGTSGSSGATNGGASTAGTSGSSGSPNGNGGSTGIPNVAACNGLPIASGASDGGSCVGVSFEAEALPVDMYVLMDRSSSMAEVPAGGTVTRWEQVRNAVEQFVSNPAAAGMGVGIQFFGQSSLRDDAIDCDVSRYATPEVGIGLLPGVGSSLVSAIDAHFPRGLTPTMPALQGGVQYASEWARQHPGRVTVVVLVTDGFPTQCQDPISINDIADVAAAAANADPSVRTYVIGLEGTLNLDLVARLGGTTQAYVIGQGDIAGPFIQALLNITQSPLSCRFEIPAPADPGQVVDYAKVQVVYTPAAGEAEEIPKLDSAAGCASAPNGGWYYDDPSAPKNIEVCGCNCARFGAGRVEVRLGCAPRRGPLG